MADHFGVAESTVAAQVKSGQIPAGCYVRMGRVYRFDLEKIEQVLLDQTTKRPDDGQTEFDFGN
jgi:hypothetical protein